MPWETQTPAAGSWVSQEEDRAYFTSYYTVDDYIVDESWGLSEPAGGEWELAA